MYVQFMDKVAWKSWGKEGNASNIFAPKWRSNGIEALPGRYQNVNKEGLLDYQLNCMVCVNRGTEQNDLCKSRVRITIAQFVIKIYFHFFFKNPHISSLLSVINSTG